MMVVIDELPALGHLQPVMDGYNLAAGKGVHFWTFAQSVSALDETWGADSRKTLMHLAEVVQVLGWPRMDVEGAEVLSKAIGAATFENRSESRSGQIREATLLPEGQGSIQESLSVVKEQLVPADEILSMGPDDQFVIASPKDMPRDVIRLKHARYWMLKDVGGPGGPEPLCRPKGEVAGRSCLTRDRAEKPGNGQAKGRPPLLATGPPCGSAQRRGITIRNYILGSLSNTDPVFCGPSPITLDNYCYRA